MKSLSEKVMVLFEKKPGGLFTVYDVAKETGTTPAEAAQAIEKLVEEGLVLSEGALWGEPFYVAYPSFYRLRRDAVAGKLEGVAHLWLHP